MCNKIISIADLLERSGVDMAFCNTVRFIYEESEKVEDLLSKSDMELLADEFRK